MEMERPNGLAAFPQVATANKLGMLLIKLERSLG